VFWSSAQSSTFYRDGTSRLRLICRPENNLTVWSIQTGFVPVNPPWLISTRLKHLYFKVRESQTVNPSEPEAQTPWITNTADDQKEAINERSGMKVRIAKYLLQIHNDAD
jgi:hypothetical protein